MSSRISSHLVCCFIKGNNTVAKHHWDHRSTVLINTVYQFTPSEDFVGVLLKCIQETSQHLRVALAPPNNPHILMMRTLLEMTMQLRLSQNYATVLALLQRFVMYGVTVVCFHICVNKTIILLQMSYVSIILYFKGIIFVCDV